MRANNSNSEQTVEQHSEQSGQQARNTDLRVSVEEVEKAKKEAEKSRQAANEAQIMAAEETEQVRQECEDLREQNEELRERLDSLRSEFRAAVEAVDEELDVIIENTEQQMGPNLTRTKTVEEEVEETSESED